MRIHIKRKSRNEITSDKQEFQNTNFHNRPSEALIQLEIYKGDMTGSIYLSDNRYKARYDIDFTTNAEQS